MNLRDVLKRNEGRIVVSAPEVKINKYLSLEFGNYWDTINNKPTKDVYFGIKFQTKW